MVKGRGKSKVLVDNRVREKAWPLVTSDICEKCPIRCPAGVSYMEKMHTGNKIGYGVTCRKDLFVERLQKNLHPFRDISILIKQGS